MWALQSPPQKGAATTLRKVPDESMHTTCRLLERVTDRKCLEGSSEGRGLGQSFSVARWKAGSGTRQ